MIKAGIVGATGYTGLELLRLLVSHPYVTLQTIISQEKVGIPISTVYSTLNNAPDLIFSSLKTSNLVSCDVVFFATPHGVAMKQAKALLSYGIKIIDLSADFRFKDPCVFQKWYNIQHVCPELLKESVYGLVELNREAIQTAKIIGNPGCYPTTIQLGFFPLLRENLVDTMYLIADCKSGLSGAGRKTEVQLLFSEVANNFKAYSVSAHRHTPEILEQLTRFTTEKIRLVFTPHLAPMIRGMYSTLYARLTKEIDNAELQILFENTYKDELFVDVMPFGSYPETRTTLVSNILRIALHRPYNDDILVILVVQDNLLKGASGQAVQCMNVMFGLQEVVGLLHPPVTL